MANNMESNDPVTSRDQNYPTNKRALGENLTRLAQNKLYGRTDVIPTGPMLDSYIINGSKALVKFKYAGSGLVLCNVSALYGFEIAGADGVFHTADAVITGSDTVEVTCNDVSQPIYVRFMHEAFPHPLTLYNSEGLVASPFAPDLPINFNLTR